MGASIYIRLSHRVQLGANDQVRLKEIAQIIAPEDILPELMYTEIYTIKPSDGQLVIIDAMTVIDKLMQKWPHSDLQMVGPSQTIVYASVAKKPGSIILFLFVWFLLFMGAALTIMNFHEDVSMREVHIKLYEIVTGEKTDYPLIFQIPYSIGLGAGMVLFFNHLFKKRFNEEPSPLEVEMFNYQQDLDQYAIINENKTNRQCNGYRP
ncbi:stage V sporulation protein AA [Bacillus ectoiniformans]|uniref:stage V sporulation protein AA n=1 Tax=Bacillus ectoiniformans TaxID=1494429 RepID=UPI00195A70FA|nr:stage V sporulation protein AA [Bacillus ectoiniformans]MBM7648046.1 stage V sporulation protein AA [Bacillus ectoiniformans]